MNSDINTWYDHYSQEYYIIAKTNDLTAIKIDDAEVIIVKNEGLEEEFNEIELLDDTWLSEFSIPCSRRSMDILDHMYHISNYIFGEILWEHEDLCLVKWYDDRDAEPPEINTQYNFRYLSKQFNYRLYMQLKNKYSDAIAWDITNRYNIFKGSGIWFLFTIRNDSVNTFTCTETTELYKLYSKYIDETSKCDVVIVNPSGQLIELYEKQE